MFLRLSLITMLGFLSACGGHQTDGFVGRSWSENMRQLGIYPIYPPREDFQVGDVYLSPTSPERAAELDREGRVMPLAVWLSSLDLRKAINSFYVNRPEFPKTSDAVAAAIKQQAEDGHKVVGQPTGDANMFTKTTPANRLRLVGFPEFLSASYRGGNLGAFIPAEGFLLGLGFGAEDVESVTFKVPAAESFGLPAPLVLSSLVDRSGKLNLKEIKNVTPESLPAYIPSGQQDKSGTLPKKFYIAVVTEVFYARTIDISTGFKSSFAAKAKADVPASLAGSNAATLLGAPATSGGQGNATAADNSPEAVARKLAAAQAAALPDRTTPGVAVSFVSASASGLSMRRTFERPVAIGWRGVELEVELETLMVKGVAPRSSGLGPLDAPVLFMN